MAAGSGKSVGKATYEIEVIPVIDEEALAEKLESVAEQAGGAGSGKGRGRKGGGATGNQLTPAITNVEAKVKATVDTTVQKDVQAQLEKGVFKLNLDTSDIRSQIEKALQEPFKISVVADAGRPAPQETVHTAPVATGTPTSTPATRGAPSEDVMNAMTKTMRDGIDNIFRNVSDAFAAAGKGKFSQLSTAPGNQAEKAIELMNQFGMRFSDMLKLSTGAVPKAVGGSLSSKQLGRQLGLPADDPNLVALDANLRSLMSRGAEGVSPTRNVDILFKRLNEWAASAPAQAAPAAAPEPEVQRPGRVTNEEAVVAAATETRAAVKEIQRAGEKGVNFTRLNAGDISSFFASAPSKPGPRTQTETGPGLFDLQAELKARGALGVNERANVRRRRGSAGDIGGIQLEPFLRAAESGVFHNVFERFDDSGTSLGLEKGTAETRGAFDALSRLGKRRPGQRFAVAGQEGKFEAVQPLQALQRMLIEATGSPEAVEQLGEQQLENVKKALQRGANPISGTSGPTKRGQGGATPLGGASDLGAEAKRLFSFIDFIDRRIEGTEETLARTNADIEKFAGQGRPTEGLEEHARDLSARLQTQRRERADAMREREALFAGPTRESREAELARNQLNQRLVAEGVGLDEAEQLQRGYQAGTSKRVRGILGEDPTYIVNALREQFLANGGRGQYEFDEEGNRIPGGSTSRTGVSALAAAAFGPTGKPVRRARAGADQGVYGQIMERLPEGTPAALRREVGSAVAAMLQGVIGNERFLSDIVETDLKRREPMASVRPGTTSRTISSGLTGEGQYRYGPGQRAALETDIAAREAKLAELEAKAARGTPRRTGEETDLQRQARLQTVPNIREEIRKLTYGAEAVPERGEAAIIGLQQMREQLAASEARRENEAAETTQAVTTRQKTMGRTPKTGDYSVAYAREAGLTMPAEEPPARESLADYAARYAGGGGAGGGGGGEGGGAGGRGFGGVSGPIPVVVTNWPEGWGGGSGKEMPEEQYDPRATYSFSPTEPEHVPPEYKPAAPGPGQVAAEKDFLAALFSQIEAGQPNNPFEKRQYDRDQRYLSGAGVAGAESDFMSALFNQIEASQPNVGYERRQYDRDRRYISGTAAYGSEKDFIEALFNQIEAGQPNDRYEKRQYDREQRYLSGANPTTAEREFLAALAANNPTGPRRETAMRRTAREQIRGGPLDQDTIYDEEQERLLTRQEERTRREARRARRLNPETTIGFENEAQAQFQEIAGTARIASRSIPRRGFGASLTDLITGSLSGRIGNPLEKQLAAQGRIDTELADLRQNLRGRAEAQYDKQRAEELLPQLAQGSQRWKVVNERLQQADAAIKGYNVGIKNSTDLVNEQVKIIKANRGAAFGAAAVGSIASTVSGAFTFGLGSAIAAPIISAVAEAVTQGLGPAIERASGFQATTGRVTSAAADEIRARGGDVGAVAGIAAKTGISAQSFDRISPLITQRADVEAGNKALQEQIDLLHTSEQLNRQQQGLSVDRGLIATTGGAFGTPLFGIPSTQELLNKELAGVGSIVPGASEPAGGLRAMQGMTGNEIAAFGKEVDIAASRLNFFNDAAEKGGSSLKLMKGNVDEVSRSAQAARDAGLFDFAATLEKEGLKVQGAQTGTDVQSFIAAINRGATTPDPRLLLEDSSRERLAKVQQEDALLQFQVGTQLPQQRAISLAQQGFGSGSPITARAGINTRGVSASEQKTLNTELGQTQRLYDQINTEVDSGVKAAKEFVATSLQENPQFGKDFADALDKSIGYAKQIAQIDVGVQTKQAAFQAESFAVQIQIAKRHLADAKGLVSGIGDNLGAVERQMFNLQRESQALALGMQQKQINFQVAMAGFTAPGLTGEERAARIQQAKIEADYAQKQLDIQKKLFGLSGKQFNMQAVRQVQDLTAQLGLLEKGRVVALETAAAEKKIKALTALQAKENDKVQAYYSMAVNRTQDIIGEEAKLVAATGKAIGQITNDVLDAFIKTYKVITNTLTQPTSRQEEDTGKTVSAMGNILFDDSTHAEGAGIVNGATSFGKYGIGGEAGGEAFVILRDPRKLNVSPMGNSQPVSTINIIIQGNKFTSEDEENRIMRKLTQAVRDAQGRELALRGLRNA